VKTTDGGGTWSEPVVLKGVYSSSVPAKVQAIRQIATHGNLVFAATDAGLFRSTDAGKTFQLVELPHPSGKEVAGSVWSIVAAGTTGWVASGTSACDVGQAPPPIYFGEDVDPASCPLGNVTVIWTSPDGQTWSPATLPKTSGTGRTTIAAGTGRDAATTVVYA